MSIGAAVVGGSVLSGFIGAKGAKDAAGISARASQQAGLLSQAQFDQTRQDLSGFRSRGEFAGQQLADFGRSRIDPNDFIPQSDIPEFDFNFEESPGFKFRQEEQERSINRQSAGLGKFLSGNRLEEILQRSGDLASQEFGQSFNRAVTKHGIATGREREQFGRGLTRFGIAQGQEQDFLNRLQSLSSAGLGAATRTGQFGAQNAAAQSQALMSAAQAQGAGRIGQAQAFQSGIGNLSLFAGLGGFGGGGGGGLNRSFLDPNFASGIGF